MLDRSNLLERQNFPGVGSLAVYLTASKAYLATIEDEAGEVLEFKLFPKPESMAGADATAAWLWCDVKREDWGRPRPVEDMDWYKETKKSMG